MLDTNKKESAYPKLRIGKEGQIVLFQKPTVGMVVSEGGKYPVGVYLGIWHPGEFVDFDGELTMRNSKVV